MADERTNTPALRAQIWHEEALRLAARGQHTPAALMLTEAIARYRERCGPESPERDELRPKLAQCLRALAACRRLGLTTLAPEHILCLPSRGPKEEVLALLGEAVAVYRELWQDRPDVFGLDLAVTLRDLSTWQALCTLPEEALSSVREACTLLRDRTARADLPELAHAIHHLSQREAEMGLLEEALSTAGEAVSRYRALAERSPAAFLPLLVLSLDTLALRQSDMGLREEALSSVTRAVTLRRTLAHSDLDAHAPALARSLNNLSNRQREVGLHREALASAEESVALLRAQIGRDGGRYRDELAVTLQTLSNCRGALGDVHGALESIEEAVVFCRALCDTEQDATYVALAAALRSLARRRLACGFAEIASLAASESVEIYRSRAQRSPACAIEAVRCLETLAAIETHNRAWGEVVSCAERALPLLSPLLETHPSAVIPAALRLLTLALEAAERSGGPPPALIAFAMHFHTQHLR